MPLYVYISNLLFLKTYLKAVFMLPMAASPDPHTEGAGLQRFCTAARLSPCEIWKVRSVQVSRFPQESPVFGPLLPTFRLEGLCHLGWPILGKLFSAENAISGRIETSKCQNLDDPRVGGGGGGGGAFIYRPVYLTDFFYRPVYLTEFFTGLCI